VDIWTFITQSIPMVSQMIRKFLTCLLMAFFGNELINIWLYDMEPDKTVAIVSFLVSIYLLFRLLFAIIIVEYYIEQHGNKTNDK